MLQPHSKGTILHLHIQPGAGKTEIAGPYGDALKIRVQAPPVDGKANQALLRFLSRFFAIPSSRVHLLKGEAGRKKSVLLEGLSTETIKGLLEN